MQQDKLKLENIIKSLEKDIHGLKKEIQERDETIQDKVCAESSLKFNVLNQPLQCYFPFQHVFWNVYLWK